MLMLSNILLFSMPGGPELLLILFVVLLLFGAKRIPDLARGLGKGIREFKDASREIKREIDTEAKRIDPNNE
ncbi:MAG: twin-arginine translocase TatA/TatE family subunit [Bacteroidota bacterium]